MTKNKNTMTFISRAAPYGSANAKHCMDIALAASVFQQNINYIFLDDGVYQLLQNQTPASIDCKPVGSALEAFELYDIKNIYVDAESLRRRNISLEQLVIKAEPIDSQFLTGLIQSSDTVFNL